MIVLLWLDLILYNDINFVAGRGKPLPKREELQNRYRTDKACVTLKLSGACHFYGGLLFYIEEGFLWPTEFAWGTRL